MWGKGWRLLSPIPVPTKQKNRSPEEFGLRLIDTLPCSDKREEGFLNRKILIFDKRTIK
jgi:hypothetical protein